MSSLLSYQLFQKSERMFNTIKLWRVWNIIMNFNTHFNYFIFTKGRQMGTCIVHY